MKKINYELSLTGFIVALLMISLLASSLALFTASVETEYNTIGNTSFSKYNQTKDLINEAEQIRNSTTFSQKQGVLDIIGNYFSSGYSALKITSTSIDLFNEMSNDASNDIGFFSTFHIMTYIYSIILILIFVGVIIAVLVKMRI
jgi:hypothetical protein